MFATLFSYNLPETVLPLLEIGIAWCMTASFIWLDRHRALYRRQLH